MVELVIFLVLFFMGLFFGRFNESRHYASIHRREQEQLHRPAMSFDAEELTEEAVQSELAVGSVVIAVDYFKQFASGLRMFFGGELKSYSSLIDRARREALLRMKESHPQADLFLNTRFETTSISKGAKETIGSIEMLAYGTAVTYKK